MSMLPAGLSSMDSLDVNLASSSSPPPLAFDQWSDTHETMETDDERDIQEVATQEEDLDGANKVTGADKTIEINTPSPTTVAPGAQQHISDEDATSVHSMPAVPVVEPSSPAPMTSQSASSHFTPSRSSNAGHAPRSLAAPGRNGRPRAMPDARASNRLSGFFSSLIHRRDTITSHVTDSGAQGSPHAQSSSRGSSPIPSRTSTPPPRLPSPSLMELGLTLSSVTDKINVSHANGPPLSGAFLKPHYLLLCHAQGLDVLPLVHFAVLQPYALIRRVSFKSIVIMEHRGVLVAIAGRRNGVRVYALEDIRRAVEWRIEVEIRKEQEHVRRSEAKRPLLSTSAAGPRSERRASLDKHRERTPLAPVSTSTRGKRRSSFSIAPPASPSGPVRTNTARRPKTADAQAQSSPTTPTPAGPPPAYSTNSPPRGLEHSAIVSAQTRSRSTSLSDVLSGTLSRRQTGGLFVERRGEQRDAKAEWASSDDDEAINVVAAPSGSLALDERTSSVTAISGAGPAGDVTPPRIEVTRTQTISSMQRRNRPANLDLSRTNSITNVTPEIPPSPAPTLLTLRQALSISPHSSGMLPTLGSLNGIATANDGDAEGDADEEDDGDPDPSSPTTPTRERISLVEALMESRLPHLPPAGTRHEQEAILIGAQSTAPDDFQPSSPRTSDSGTMYSRRSTGDQSSTRRRRRWSVLDGIFFHSPTNSQSSFPTVQEGVSLGSVASATAADSVSEMQQQSANLVSSPGMTPSQSNRIAPSDSRATIRPATSPRPLTPSGAPVASSQTSLDRPATAELPPLPSTARFLPRIITSAFQSRRSDDLPSLRTGDLDAKRAGPLAPPTPVPPPKLEYAKLPGTKGAVLVKAVETAKKSFLAILCGENGEKVELFAGTYRTALQLSRTFILPDSPKSLELQLQGDDLVEVFLVFTQNVFGLEPATVRVREVRIGRAERRAARRRARGLRTDQSGEVDAEGNGAGEEDTAVNVTIVSPPNAATVEDGTASPGPGSSTALPQTPDASQSQIDCSSVTASTDELVTLAAAHTSPYTTFQQLLFAPNFPLATISDDYIIPPTYNSFLQYRAMHEPEVNGDPNVDLSQVQFSPPGLPVPTPAPPSRWFYKDPKGIVHGPWKATLMQAWYRDGLLPPDLPVRREEDNEYIMLKDLRLQCVDPTHPFRSAPPLPMIPQPLPVTDASKPLLPPISLLTQPRHFGPPALFYSSRGGHSTTIVDARGRSVLKGRFLWSADDQDENPVRLGDVKRLEAFDVEDRAVLVAMRQGGLEAVDFGDALLRPADHSRAVCPHFQPPPSAINRRGPFLWKIGSPLNSHPSISSISSATAIPPSSKFAQASHRKKVNTGPVKSPRSEFTLSGDPDSDRMQDEVLFLGRKDDELYICERRPHSFRILKLSPSPPQCSA
ncbi:uncharacterized protein LAESUDRAFT_759018 [Laetiporus sulphureus 93-53]|uniref:GYF domain-containing protein n=1 Tax=Laetiporus sulphureus 93-53 TaxID=1314785 RepID=A0A165EE57_9APHY|nr:uncharacterized protein LAESUDRAFT_759018 [Laetiporus sulphureus 93-53]KZT06845.1 hypothetical protein LAESUDRAFT_759018 [Laetiporus sulphureus 93-53]